MKIYPKSDPEDPVEVSYENGMCALSVYVTPIGLSCVYLDLEEVEQLQKGLANTAAKLRGKLAKEATS